MRDLSLQRVGEGDVRDDKHVSGAVNGIGDIALRKTESHAGNMQFLPEGCRFLFAVMRHGRIAPHCTVDGRGTFVVLVVNGGEKEVD